MEASTAYGYLVLAGQVAIALAAIIGFWRLVKEPVTRFWRSKTQWVRSLAALPQMVEDMGKVSVMEGQVRAILHQVSPNGSSSMNDAIRRIESMQIEATGSISKLTDQVTLLSAGMRVNLDADNSRALFEADSDGRNLWVNKTYCRWVNLNDQELLGYGWLNAIALKDRARVRAEVETAITERRMLLTKYHLLNSDETEFSVDMTLTPIPPGVEKPQRWIGIIRKVGYEVD